MSLSVSVNNVKLNLLRTRPRRRISFRQIHLLPLPSHDSRTNLSRTLPKLRLLIAVHRFFLAYVANRPVIIPKAIQQTRVPNLAVTTTVTRLLIEHRLHLRRHRINLLCPSIRKLLWIKRLRQRPGKRRSVVRRTRFEPQPPPSKSPPQISEPSASSQALRKSTIEILEPGTQIVSRLSGTGTLAVLRDEGFTLRTKGPVLRRPHNPIRAPTAIGSSPDSHSPSTNHAPRFSFSQRD